MTQPCACGRGVGGLLECCCTGCLAAGRPAHFSTPRVFDLHWVGRGEDRHCVDPATLTRRNGEKSMSSERRASGLVWVTHNTRPHPFARQNPSPTSGTGHAG